MHTDDCFQFLSLFDGERRTPDKTAMQVTIRACCQFHVCFLLDLLFRPEDWDNIFLRSISWLSLDYMAAITTVTAAAQEVLCRAHPSAGASLNAHGHYFWQLLLLHPEPQMVFPSPRTPNGFHSDKTYMHIRWTTLSQHSEAWTWTPFKDWMCSRCHINIQLVPHKKPRIAQLVQRLAISWTTKGLEFEFQ